MPYVAPSTVTTLQTYTSAAHNIIVNDIISFRDMTGIVPPMCRIQKATGTTYTYGSSIDFGATTFDTNAMVTSSSMITIKTAGVYEITCGITVTGSSAWGNTPTFRPIINSTTPGPANNLALQTGLYYTGLWVYTRSFAVNETISMSLDYSSGGTVTLLATNTGGNTFLQAKFLGSTS